MSGRSFGLTSASDLLAKLEREYERFCAAEHKAKSDHAFNFAITAWHLTDWAWKEKVDETGGALGFAKFDHFHSHVRSESEAIQICYEIATGSKHFTLKEEKAKTVQGTRMSASSGGGITRSATSSVVRPVVTSVTGSHAVRRLVIKLKSGRTLPAERVFRQALEYWQEFFRNAET